MKHPNIPTSNGFVGRQHSQSLFSEEGPYDLEKFHKVFLKCEDLTEYEPAIKLVGSWVEWNRIKRDWPSFKSVYVKGWIEELEVIFKSRAIKQITESAKNGNFPASKWIAEHGFDKRQGAGRPSKSEQKRAAKEIAEQSADTQKDKARVLKLVNGD